jgi:hypothetical protein
MALLALANNFRRRPGYITSMGCMTGILGYTLWQGSKFENPLIKYVLAGTSAQVTVEVLTHALDTMNMRAKIIDGPKASLYYLLKAEGIAPLFKGIQPIIYGYTFSSFVYFSIYAESKKTMKRLLGIENSHH